MRINRGAIADLHIHTKESDGIKSPHKIIMAVRRTKLKTLALTDHHTTRGYDIVAAIAEWYGIKLIPGIEISTSDYKSLHILGYGMSDRAHLDSLASQNSYSNEMQLLRILDKLEEHGIILSEDFVDEMINKKQVNRRFIAKELAAEGYARSEREAYKKLVGPSGLASMGTHKFSAKEAIEMITDAGGVPCLAHPRYIRYRETKQHLPEKEMEHLIADLTSWGLKGIESLPSPRAETDKRKFFQSAAENFHLLPVGGTDYHGNKKDIEESLGNPHVTPEHIENLLQEIRLSNAEILTEK